MKAGIVAGAGLNQVSGADLPPWLPTDAVAHVDFVNGQYFAGATVRSVADLFDSDFDAARIDASGYLMDRAGGTAWLRAEGALFDDMDAWFAAGMTLVYQVYHGTYAVKGTLLHVSETMFAYGGQRFDHFLHPANSGDNGAEVSDWFTGTICIGSGGDGSQHNSGAANKLAFTLNRDAGGGNYEHGYSINGNTPVSATVAYDITTYTTPVSFFIGGERQNNLLAGDHASSPDAYLQTLTIYPAVAASTLDTLSA